MLHCSLITQTLLLAEHHGIAVTQLLSMAQHHSVAPPSGVHSVTHLVLNGCLLLDLLQHCSVFTDVALLIWQSVMLLVFVFCMWFRRLCIATGCTAAEGCLFWQIHLVAGHESHLTPGVHHIEPYLVL